VVSGITAGREHIAGNQLAEELSGGITLPNMVLADRLAEPYG
jgi:hypothetical protein